MLAIRKLQVDLCLPVFCNVQKIRKLGRDVEGFVQ